ncbi:MAG TPA: Nramp family divalent metal transporter [Blastocatellia bacterium]|nr:Nramp family divalent metal transporter [Blastocatellia bacterium]
MIEQRTVEASEARSPEARSGLDPWNRAELPAPPMPKGLGWMGVVGPGVIVLGMSIGSGEFLLGPAAFVNYGFALLWITTVAVFLQTMFNFEVMRYTLATGEPAITGFMRTRPSSSFWGWFYVVMYFLQMGWPAWAGNAAAAIFLLSTKRLPGPADSNVVYMIGAGTFVVCVLVLLVGRRIERTLELLNWVLILVILSSFLVLALMYADSATWVAAGAGFVGYDTTAGRFSFLPAGADYFLLGALAAYSGCGGMGNITLTNWARDKGYGMSQITGYIPALVGGQKVHLAHTGSTFTPNEESIGRWRGWWRIIKADQWAVFFVGAMLGMVLPALLYVAFLPRGSEIRGMGIGAALAHAMVGRTGALAAGAVAFMGAWILLKTQLDIIEGMTRAITDIIWTSNKRARAWRGGDVRAVYYSVLGVTVVWGLIALRLVQPIVLLQLGANMAGIVFIIASIHILYVNTTLLPKELRPSLGRRACLVAMALFYGFFVVLWLSSMF